MAFLVFGSSLALKSQFLHNFDNFQRLFDLLTFISQSDDNRILKKKHQNLTLLMAI